MKTASLTASETEWVGQQLTTATLLARAYIGDSEDLPRLDQLDATWLAWQDDVSPTRPDANIVVNALGIAFGKHLATTLGLIGRSSRMITEPTSRYLDSQTM